MASQRSAISKEDREEFIRDKMEKMKKKSEEILRRHAEVEADKRNADVLSMQITKKQTSQISSIEKKVSNTVAKPRRTPQPNITDDKTHLKEIEERKRLQRLTKENGPPPDPVNFLADPYRDGMTPPHATTRTNRRHHVNYGGRDFQNVKYLMKEQRKYERQYPQMTNNDLMLQMTGKERKEYENWKAERLKIDEERIARQLTSSGSWKREWDLNKVEEDREITQKTENVYYKQPKWLTETGNNQVGRGNRNSFNPIVVESSNEIDIKSSKERSVVLNENNSLTIVKNSEIKDASFGSKKHEDLQKSQEGKWQYERKNTFAENEGKTYAKRESWKQDNGKKTNFKITAKGDGWDILPPSQNKDEKKWKQNESSFNYDYCNPEEGKKFNQKNNENWEATENDKKKQLNIWNSDSQEKFHGRKYKFTSSQENFEEVSNNRCVDGTKFEFREGERQWNRTKKYSDNWDEDGWTKSKDNRIRNEGNWNRSKDNWTRKASDGWENYNNNTLNEYKNKHFEKSRGTNFRGNKKNYNSGMSGKLKSNENGWCEEEKYENNGWCAEEKYENTNQKKSSFVWENNLNRREKSEVFDEKTSNEYNWDFKKRNDRKQNNSGGKRFRENHSYRNNQFKNFSVQRNKGEFHKRNSESVSESYSTEEWQIDTSVPTINDGWEFDNTTDSNAVESKGEWESQPDSDVKKESVNSCNQWISNSGFETENIESKTITEGESHDDSWEDVTTSGCESSELSGPNEEISPKVKDDDIEVDSEQNLIKNSFVVHGDDENESNTEIDEYKQEKGIHLEEIGKISVEQENLNVNIEQTSENEELEIDKISAEQENLNFYIEQTSENEELNSEQINEMINIENKENGNNSENVCSSKSEHKNFTEENVSESIENSSVLFPDNVDFQENSQDSCKFPSNNLLDTSVSHSDDESNIDCEILSSEYSNKKNNSFNQTNRDCDAVFQNSEIYQDNELNSSHLRENDNSKVKEEINSFENKEEITEENHKIIELIKEENHKSIELIKEENHTEFKKFETKEQEEETSKEIFEKSETFGKELKESCRVIEENSNKFDKMKYETIKEFEDKNKEIIESNGNCDTKENEYPVIKEVNDDKVEFKRNEENSNKIFEECKMLEEAENKEKTNEMFEEYKIVENKESVKANQSNINLKECEIVNKIESDEKINSKGNSDEILEECELYNKFEYEDKDTNSKQNCDIKEKEYEHIKELDDKKERDIKNSDVEKENELVMKIENESVKSGENLDIEKEKHEINQFEDQTEKEAPLRCKDDDDKEKDYELMKKLDNDNREKLELNENYKIFEESKSEIVKTHEDKENMTFIEESKENNRIESDIVKNSDDIVNIQNSINNSVISEKLDQETKVENIENPNLDIEKDLIIKYNENKSMQEIRTFASISDSVQSLITETNFLSQENSNIDKQDICLSHINQTEQLMENEENSVDQHLNQRTVRKALATESITEFTEVLEVTASVPLRSAMQEIEKTSNISSIESKMNLDCKDDIFKIAE